MPSESDQNSIFSVKLLGIQDKIAKSGPIDDSKRKEFLIELYMEAMRCLFRKNVPQTTIVAFVKVMEFQCDMYLMKAFRKWGVGFPDFAIDAHRQVILASDVETELLWGDLVIFPNRREGMTPEIFRQREHTMFFAANVFITTKTKLEIFKDVNLETFQDGKVRDDMDPDILLQVEIECLLFWWLKMDKIYDFESDELVLQSGAKRAVLNIL